MIRTQVYLPYSEVGRLKRMASEEETSMSEILRRLIREKLEVGKKPTKKAGKKRKHVLDRFLALAKKMKVSGPPDLATNMDEYLYGSKK